MIILSSTLIAILGLSGCTTKEPVVEEKPIETITVVPETVSETTAAEESAVAIDLSPKVNLNELQGKIETINFDFDKYDIRPDMEAHVIANSEIANGEAADYKIRLEGNCDNWGSDEYNYALGLRRANAVKAAMIAEGVSEARISMISYGETNPVCTDNTIECWKQNRRVELKLIP